MSSMKMMTIKINYNALKYDIATSRMNDRIDQRP